MNIWRQPSQAYSIVRDWNKLQGMTHVSDEHIQIRRDLDARHVSIENSGERAVGVAIATYIDFSPIPKLQMILKPGEIKDVGINTIGGPMQYIHILDPTTQKHLGYPTSFRTDSNQFVLRDGLNSWFVQAFKKPGYVATR